MKGIHFEAHGISTQAGRLPDWSELETTGGEEDERSGEAPIVSQTWKRRPDRG